MHRYCCTVQCHVCNICVVYIKQYCFSSLLFQSPSCILNLFQILNAHGISTRIKLLFKFGSIPALIALCTLYIVLKYCTSKRCNKKVHPGNPWFSKCSWINIQACKCLGNQPHSFYPGKNAWISPQSEICLKCVKYVFENELSSNMYLSKTVYSCILNFYMSSSWS
jgi:hypothetical protein